MLYCAYNFSILGDKFKFNRFAKHFPSLIQARNGRSGSSKWWKSNNTSVGRGGSNYGSNGSEGFLRSRDNFKIKKTNLSPEIQFFSSGKGYSSYPLNHHNPNPHDTMIDVLKTTIIPWEIKEYLDKYVIGQEHAKKVIAVAVYNHYCRVRSILNSEPVKNLDDSVSFNKIPQDNLTDEDVIVPEKSNILLIGPSGSGKTLLAKTVSRLLKVPFAMGDATSLTEAGYVGEDVDTLLYRLLEKAKFNETLAQSGIVFLDEVDKIARTGGGVKGSTNTGGGRDVGGEGVQHALLKMLEGTVVQVVDRRKAGREYISFDTSNLLFILSGAFVGLEGIINARSAVASIGFSKSEIENSETGEKIIIGSSAILGSNSSHWMGDIQTSDIINYGLIPEFIGRVPIMAILEELDEQTLVRTLTEPRNSLIKQYQHLFKMNGVDLVFTEDALLAIGRISIEGKTGARGLRGIMEKLLLPLMYDIPSKREISRVIIEKDFVEGKSAARVENGKADIMG